MQSLEPEVMDLVVTVNKGLTERAKTLELATLHGWPVGNIFGHQSFISNIPQLQLLFYISARRYVDILAKETSTAPAEAEARAMRPPARQPNRFNRPTNGYNGYPLPNNGFKCLCHLCQSAAHHGYHHRHAPY